MRPSPLPTPHPFHPVTEAEWRALATTPTGHPLHALAHRICRAARRAHHVLGLGLILLARRLDLRAVLPGPPWLLPDPDLSQTLACAKIPPFTGAYGTIAPYRRLLRGLAALHRAAAGRARIPRSLRLGWACPPPCPMPCATAMPAGRISPFCPAPSQFRATAPTLRWIRQHALPATGPGPERVEDRTTP